MLGSFETGLAALYGWPSPILMIFIGSILLYLGIAKKMEPSLTSAYRVWCGSDEPAFWRSNGICG